MPERRGRDGIGIGCGYYSELVRFVRPKKPQPLTSWSVLRAALAVAVKDLYVEFGSARFRASPGPTLSTGIEKPWEVTTISLARAIESVGPGIFHVTSGEMVPQLFLLMSSLVSFSPSAISPAVMSLKAVSTINRLKAPCPGAS